MPLPPPAQLRAIFFDAGNTLLRMNYAAISERLAAAGHPLDPARLQRADWRARVRLDAHLLSGVSTESVSTADLYLRYLLEEAGTTDAALVETMATWRRGYNPPVGVWNTADPDAEAALVLARAGGLAVGVISNSNGSVESILRSLGLRRHLDFVLDSFEVGVEKPDVRIFEIALDRAGVQAGEALYVGDLYSVDVVGARRAGLEAVLLDPGACWGARDCHAVSSPLAAVQWALSSRRGPEARRRQSGSVTDG
jgi:putative hydrolase of the HAD superfamily